MCRQCSAKKTKKENLPDVNAMRYFPHFSRWQSEAQGIWLLHNYWTSQRHYLNSSFLTPSIDFLFLSSIASGHLWCKTHVHLAKIPYLSDLDKWISLFSPTRQKRQLFLMEREMEGLWRGSWGMTTLTVPWNKKKLEEWTVNKESLRTYTISASGMNTEWAGRERRAYMFEESWEITEFGQATYR